MSCILRIIGAKFDVDTFVAKSKVRPYKVFYKGEPRIKGKPHGAKQMHSGLAIQVGKSDMANFRGQVQDAIRFLTRNREKLRYISQTKGIQHAILDFGIDRKVDSNRHLIETNFLPNRLLQLAGEMGLGIEFTFYAEDMQTQLEPQITEKTSY